MVRLLVGQKTEGSLGAISMRRSTPVDRASASGSLAYLTAGVLAALLYAAHLSDALGALLFAAVGVGTAAVLVLGPRWHRAAPRHPWYLLSAASFLFLIGALVRPWAAHRTGISALAADAFTVPGYLLMIFGVGGLLRARGGLERHAVIDGLIVCLGAACVSVLLLAVPAASIQGRSVMVSALAGTYPVFDVVLLLLLVNLAFTTAARRPSYWLLVGMMTSLLLGDLAYAIVGLTGTLSGAPILDLPFLIGFAMVGAAALHPSVVYLGRAMPLPVQAWSWPRLLLICPALAAPFVLIAALHQPTLVERLVPALAGAVMVALLLVRAVSAVQGYATAQRRYEHHATHDPLTGLPNRRALSREVGRLLRRSAAVPTGIWVYFLDLDGFKMVNDSWGHDTGDQLIVQVGQRLRALVPSAAVVARVGGDEFVVVLSGTRDEAVELAEGILGSFAAPLQVGGIEVVVSTSVGLVGTTVVPTGEHTGSRDGLAYGVDEPTGSTGGWGGLPTAAAAEQHDAAPVTAESLMRDADIAMYHAKAEGPGKWALFDTSMRDRVRDRVEIEFALRHALAKEQLHLVYQPIVELRGGRLVGAEALLRWDHPVRGAVSPLDFISIAEDTGLIAAIGRWVLDEALRQLADWRRHGVVDDEFWISVNVSPRQLRDPGLPDSIAEALLRHDVPTGVVVLEITESVMVDPSAGTDQVLFELRGMGVRIVVDDFGTGYSALGYLRRHPVTGVKVDQAFVGGLGGNPEDEEIVRAVVAMSSALRLTVVAEGVETPTQRAVLEALGVLLGQGRLWGGPVRPNLFAQRWSGLAVGADGAGPVVGPDTAQLDSGGSNNQ
ncbi:EAL domain-containing protein [Micromonospora sp. NBC_01699]|uniref:putative bifunctional diguanylate cyclase/phosphodiesterase n=1 Tax=Micromonospora sp. NBC_01699 TaxID=2975984 RepID=UPI002E33AB1C|nr:EAL domain-containing protein [Micromonospora sp. NBC_01699]